MRRRSGGAWVTAQTVKRRQGGAWVTVWSAYTPFAASAVPSEIWGSALVNGSTTKTITEGTNIAATGGSGTYTYSASWLSGGSLMSISSGTTSTPTVSSSSRVSAHRTGVMRVVVSDGTSSVNVDVPVDFLWEQ